jgi:hypothetical protein
MGKSLHILQHSDVRWVTRCRSEPFTVANEIPCHCFTVCRARILPMQVPEVGDGRLHFTKIARLKQAGPAQLAVRRG